MLKQIPDNTDFLPPVSSIRVICDLIPLIHDLVSFIKPPGKLGTQG
jgi:hypothetical protein